MQETGARAVRKDRDPTRWKFVHLRLPHEVHDQLQRLAKRSERSVNAEVVWLVRRAAELTDR